VLTGPFVCQCPSSPPCSVSTPRSSNRTCGFAASGSPTEFRGRPTRRHACLPFAGHIAPSETAESLMGGTRQHGHSPDSWPLPERLRSQAPSLHRHYPASMVLRACPPPHTARPVPRGSPVREAHRPPLGFPVLRSLSVYRHARAPTPAGSLQGSGCSPDSNDGGLPQMSAGSAPALIVSRPAWRSRTLGPAGSRGRRATLCTEGFGRFVTSTTAPIATGWSNSCQVGLAPTEERRLFTAHGHPSFFSRTECCAPGIAGRRSLHHCTHCTHCTAMQPGRGVCNDATMQCARRLVAEAVRWVRGQGVVHGTCHLGATRVPQGATRVAPKIKEVVAPWSPLRRLRLGKLVGVKCHCGCQTVPRCRDHSPLRGTLANTASPGRVYLRNFLRWRRASSAVPRTRAAVGLCLTPGADRQRSEAQEL
jgi:hypothetical protein